MGNEIIRDAYEKFKAYKERVKAGEEKDHLGIWKDLHDELKQAYHEDMIIDEEFIKTYFLGNRADCAAKQGNAGVASPNFMKFMQDDRAKQYIKDMLKLMQEDLPKDVLRTKLDKIDLLRLLERTGNLKPKPWLFANRIYVILFPETLTSIADRIHLKNTCENLGIRFEADIEKEFVKAQSQIRSKIVDHIQETGDLDSLNEFDIAAVAWNLNR